MRDFPRRLLYFCVLLRHFVPPYAIYKTARTFPEKMNSFLHVPARCGIIFLEAEYLIHVRFIFTFKLFRRRVYWIPSHSMYWCFLFCPACTTLNYSPVYEVSRTRFLAVVWLLLIVAPCARMTDGILIYDTSL